MKRELVLFAVGLLCNAATFGQTYPQKSVEPRAGVGVQIDLGNVIRDFSALLGRDQASAPAFAPGQITAVWKLTDPLDGATLAAAIQGELLAQQRLEALGLHIALIGVEDERLDAALHTLRDHFPAAVFDRNALVYPQETAQDGVRTRQYAAALIGATRPEQLSRPVRIGVIDGALDVQMGITAATLAVEHFAQATATSSDHASAVACALACRVETGFAGLAPGVELVWAAVLAPGHDGRERGDTFQLARALDWMVGRHVEIIHASHGSVPNEVLARVLERTLPRVRAFVAAAGNGGPKGKPPYPAAYPGVIAVAAVDAEARPWAGGTRGEYILLAAPGVDIWLPVKQGHYFTGTSYAAPFVTAWVAQRLARGQPVDAATLCAAALDLPPSGRDEATGCGLMRWSP
jgi:hypothetical protein